MIMNAVETVSKLARGAALGLTLAFAAVAGTIAPQDAQANDRDAKTYYQGYADGVNGRQEHRRESYRYDDRRDYRDYRDYRDDRRNRDNGSCVERGVGGAVVGAALGALLGDSSKAAKRGAAIGAVAGCVTSNDIGRGRNDYRDRDYRSYDAPSYYEQAPRYYEPPRRNCTEARDRRTGQIVLVCR